MSHIGLHLSNLVYFLVGVLVRVQDYATQDPVSCAIWEVCEDERSPSIGISQCPTLNF